MGVYAQTDFTIICENEKIAKKLLPILKKIEEDEHGNDLGENFRRCKNEICGFMDSNRIQNLSYCCKELWKKIKDIEGVVEMNCPFMSEADGEFFSNEN